MTSPNPESYPPQIKPIRRKQVQQYLAISAFVATQLVTGCSAVEEEEPEAQVDPMVPALFYETTEQCEADPSRTAQSSSPDSLSQSPQGASSIPVPDCDKQIAAAHREHDRHAPVYQSLVDCQADLVQCEPTPYGYDTYGYRPSYGGTYFFLLGNVYSPYTVYRGLNGNDLVTPHGGILSRPQLGQILAPQSINVAAPPRPPGYAAVGTIKGRNINGFGSTYKNTGSGGK